jgi:hypothetical protein
MEAQNVKLHKLYRIQLTLIPNSEVQVALHQFSTGGEYSQ